MSYANGTPFLNLAQTLGTDHRDWFDENEAKLDLDTKMKTLWDGAASTADILTTLQENVASLQTDVTTLEGVVSGHTSTITTINESLVLINTALNALNTQVTNKFDSAGIADPYDASYGVYAVGDVVTYNGQRYVCNTAVAAAEPFDVSKWTAEDVQTVLDDIESNTTPTNVGLTWTTTLTVTGDVYKSAGIINLGASFTCTDPLTANTEHFIANVSNSANFPPTITYGSAISFGGVTGVCYIEATGSIKVILHDTLQVGDTLYINLTWR